MSDPVPEEHLVVVWERALPVLDRILDDAGRRFIVRDVTLVTWTPERFGRNLTRLYGTALPPGSAKEVESGTGPFVTIAIGVSESRTVVRQRADGLWEPARAALLQAKRRYRRWAGGAYRVHTTLTAAEAAKDALLILGESPRELSRRRWDGSMRERERELLGDPGWASLDELDRALRSTMRSALEPPAAPGLPARAITDDPWWTVRIVDPPSADRAGDHGSALRSISVGGLEHDVLVVDADDPGAPPEDAALLPRAMPAPVPHLIDRIASRARLRG